VPLSDEKIPVRKAARDFSCSDGFRFQAELLSRVMGGQAVAGKDEE
jgi:hypothetical protein